MSQPAQQWIDSCPHCQRWAASPRPMQAVAGGFSAQCAGCCARLLHTARPLKGAQLAMLAAVTRREGSPSKAACLEALKAWDAHSALKKESLPTNAPTSP